MITAKEIMEKAGISRSTIIYRIKQMKNAGIVISSEYQETNRAPIRVFTDEIAQMIIDWRGAKPGRKRQDARIPESQKYRDEAEREAGNE